MYEKLFPFLSRDLTNCFMMPNFKCKGSRIILLWVTNGFLITLRLPRIIVFRPIFSWPRLLFSSAVPEEYKTREIIVTALLAEKNGDHFQIYTYHRHWCSWYFVLSKTIEMLVSTYIHSYFNFVLWAMGIPANLFPLCNNMHLRLCFELSINKLHWLGTYCVKSMFINKPLVTLCSFPITSYFRICK